MAKIVIFDFHLSDAGTFLHDLASAEAETLSGGASATGSPYTFARILTIHDGINRVETNYSAGGSINDNNYNSTDNSDQVYIWAYGI
ncbi:hypothetical protein FNW02_27515 [Komarekiella sp. 'clone 1']|uniref:Uncharacterized protein n=1 Tax=Komarekiella delphini-convector SJRDD-AB1 TaxID=2593771 RepID=A0AA40T214_9NOST|nr:hypothetical protein [Komarekiella delphini-convector]MBD6619473.1 hypothetical protein [Komarekiella delphini-convector SJRDD-AB1]